MSLARSMSRKTKRDAAKAERRAQQPAGPDTGQTLTLQNPVSHHFPSFILGNAQYCDYVVEADSHKGQHVVICGAGPSLAEHADEYCRSADAVWGCNSALPWLHENGYKVTHGITTDQTPHMVAEWQDAPDVEYLIASTVHPHLVEYLLAKGRRMRTFHNYVGIERPPVGWWACTECGWHPQDDAKPEPCPECSGTMKTQIAPYEHWMYMTLYPGTVVAGSGLNTVTRAIDVARFMGFSRITVLGADCALRLKAPRPTALFGTPEHHAWLRDQTVMHANGGNALASEATPVTVGGVIDSGTSDATIREGHGRHWETKPDMMISAIWLVKMAKRWGLELVGDTLPNALWSKDDAYLKRLPGGADMFPPEEL